MIIENKSWCIFELNEENEILSILEANHITKFDAELGIQWYNSMVPDPDRKLVAGQAIFYIESCQDE